MSDKNEKVFVLRLKPQSFAILDRLAVESGRSKAAVIRRFIDMADTLPEEARRMLGDTQPKGDNGDSKIG